MNISSESKKEERSLVMRIDHVVKLSKLLYET